MPHKPGIGAIFGIVSEEGVAKPTAPVNLYDRTNGALVGHQQTDGNGGFVFNGLNADTNDYYIVATDEDNPPYKNAQIRDRIHPVPGYQGATYWANWRYLAFSKGAEILFDGQTNADGSQFVPAYLCGGRPVLRASGSTTIMEPLPAFVPSLTPGAPQIPGTPLNGNKLNVWPRSSRYAPSAGITALHQNPSACSFELVADFSTLCTDPQTKTGWVRFFASAYYNVNGGSYSPMTYAGNLYTPLVMCSYDPVGKTLRVYRASGRSSGASFDNLTEITTAPYIDMTPYQGAHHVVVSIAFGLSASVYIDGQSVLTVSLTGTNGYIGAYNDDNNGYLGAAYVSNSSNSSPASLGGAYGTLGVLALYPSALTQDDVTELYQDLMVGSLPRLTGYPKEVMIDAPQFYARLNETANATVVHNQTRLVDVYNGYTAGSGPITWLRTTPVTGGNGALLDGNSGIRFDSDGAGLLSAAGYTVECFALPATAVPASGDNEYLLEQTSTSESRNGILLYRDKDAHVGVQHSASGTEAIVFTTLLADTAAMHHYAVRVDKLTFTATLLVDGVVVETLPTNTNVLDATYAGGVGYDGHSHIGAKVNDSGVTSNGFAGTLAEVAVYGVALSDARIAAHYAARLTP